MKHVRPAKTAPAASPMRRRMRSSPSSASNHDMIGMRRSRDTDIHAQPQATGSMIQRKCSADCTCSACQEASAHAAGREAGAGNTKVQPKLQVGAADGPAEARADARTDAVMGGQLAPRPIRRSSAQESGGTPVPAEVESGIRRMQSGGSNLPETVRAKMELGFGRDLSDVRIHRDASAAGTADKLSARAFAIGNHIAFNHGEFQPGTDRGDHLIAHELAHVEEDADMVHPSLFDWFSDLVGGDDTDEGDVSETESTAENGTSQASSDEWDPYTDEYADPDQMMSSRAPPYMSNGELSDAIEALQHDLDLALPDETLDIEVELARLEDEEYLRSLIDADVSKINDMNEDAILETVELLEAAQETNRPDQEDVADAIDLFTQKEATPDNPIQRIPEDAVKGIKSYGILAVAMLPILPSSARIFTKDIVRRGGYTLVPNSREASDGTSELLYYLAYRTSPDAFEYIVGVDSLATFLSETESRAESADVPRRAELAAVIAKVDEGDWDVDDAAAKLSNHQMRMIEPQDRINMIRHIGEGYIVGNDDEKTIVRLLATTPAADAPGVLKALRSSNSSLLDTLNSAIDGDEYKAYHTALRALFFNARSPEEAMAEMDSAKELPWADPGLIGAVWNVRFYYEDFSFDDNGMLNVDLWRNKGPIGFKIRDDYKLDPMEMVKVRFYYDEPEVGVFKDKIVYMPAVNLMQLVSKQFRQELSTVADVALLGLGGVGIVSAGSKTAKAIAALDLLIAVSDIAIREFRGEIAKLPGGKEFLGAWDKVQALIAVYSLTRVVQQVPSAFRKLRATYTDFRARAGDTLSDTTRRRLDDKVGNMLDEAEDVTGNLGSGTSKGADDQASRALGRAADYDNWEAGLDTPTIDLLSENEPLRRVYQSMDPRVRRLLTLCRSPCIPTNPPPSAAALDKIEGLMRRFSISDDNIALREYLYANRNDLDSAVSSFDRISQRQLNDLYDDAIKAYAQTRGGSARRNAQGRWEYTRDVDGVTVREYENGGYGTLGADRGTNNFFQAHHGIQGQWARDLNIPGYSYRDAPAILLRDSRAGSPHRVITSRQSSRRTGRSGRTYAQERQNLMDDFRAAQVPDNVMRNHLARQDAYFAGLYHAAEASGSSAAQLQRWFGTWTP